jgi:hypothetical protein
MGKLGKQSRPKNWHVQEWEVLPQSLVFKTTFVKKELPMSIVSRAGVALQNVFGALAHEAAETSKVIVRLRKFNPVSLAQTFVLGFLENPRAGDEDLAQMAVQCGAEVTPQAIEQRHTPQLIAFLEALFRKAVTQVVGSVKALAPLLERFPAVTILDSTTVGLPDSMQECFQGCGGSYDSGASAVKLQTELDLRSGAITHVEIESGKCPDSATNRQQAQHPPGSLRITDLGYFNLKVFASLVLSGVYFLSRLQFGVKVFEANGTAIGNLLQWLSEQTGPIVDCRVDLGKTDHLSVRLIAWRMPQEQASERRRKLRAAHLRKHGHEPTAERLAWCDWSILVTSASEEKLSVQEAMVLYRARWQIELLFKRWKSQGRIADLSGSTEVRQTVRVWARLLAAVVQHWLVVSSSCGDPTRSWVKICEAIRSFVGRLAVAMDSLAEIDKVLASLMKVVSKTCSRNKRKKAGTFEMLNDVALSTYA